MSTAPLGQLKITVFKLPSCLCTYIENRTLVLRPTDQHLARKYFCQSHGEEEIKDLFAVCWIAHYAPLSLVLGIYIANGLTIDAY